MIFCYFCYFNNDYFDYYLFSFGGDRAALFVPAFAHISFLSHGHAVFQELGQRRLLF